VHIAGSPWLLLDWRAEVRNILRGKCVEWSNVLCVEDVVAVCIAYVQLVIQWVPVDQLLFTKQIKLPPVLHVNLHPCVTRKTETCAIRQTVTLYHT